MKRTFFLNIKGIRLSLLLMALALTFTSAAQIPIKVSAVRQSPPDSMDVAEGSKRHFWRAASEVMGFNLGLWAFDRYVQHGDWSYISFKTIKKNFQMGFKWDNDNLGTNTFLHPYNGSLYYNAARSNGFNYWQSGLFALGGSGMWEMFMENEYPSINDIIATPVGGMSIGEVLFRASDAVIDDRSSGFERVGREAALFILSPMRGLNRLITGQAWRRQATRGRMFGTPNFALRVSLGMRALDFQGNMKNTHIGGVVQLDAEYGDRFEAKSTKPFDYFTVRADLQIMKTQPVLTQFNIKGRLLSREFLKERNSFMSVGLYQHFDFYDSDTIGSLKKVPYKLGIPASFGVGLMFRDVEHNKWVFDCYAHANAIFLGSILSDHYRLDDRNYNWASGFSIKAGANLVFDRNKFSFSVTDELYRLYTYKGYRYGTDLSTANYRILNVQGDLSNAIFNVTEIRADFNITKHLYATVAMHNYFRSTKYRYLPHQRSYTFSLGLMASYKF